MARLITYASVAVLVCAVFVGVIVMGQAGVPPVHEQPDPNEFAFRLAYGIGAKNVLDTHAGTFTKDLIVAGTATAKLQPAREVLDGFRARIMAMDIAKYPPSFDYDRTVMTTPYMTYQLRVWLHGTEYRVCLETEHPTADPRAAALIDFVNEVRQWVESTRAYRSLPAAVGGYL